MSKTITTDIFCDDCSNWVEGVASQKIQIRNARAKAKDAGWYYFKSPLTDKMIDICPKCQEYYAAFLVPTQLAADRAVENTKSSIRKIRESKTGGVYSFDPPRSRS